MPEPKFPNRMSEMLTQQQMAGLTGIDYVRGMMVGRLPAAPIAQSARLAIVEVRDGVVVFEGHPEFAHYNPQGTVHGGWFGIALDSAMGCAVMTRLARGQSYTTLEYKVNMIRPVFDATGPLRITGTSLHAGRRTATADGRIEDQDGKLYATGSTTCLVVAIAGAADGQP